MNKFIGFLWIIGGVFMILNQSVSMGSIQKGATGFELYSVAIPIITIGILQIYYGYKENKREN
jgi:hypothetical protein